MNQHFSFKPALLAVFAAASFAGFPAFAATATMSKPDYQAAKTRIGADFKTAKVTCDALSGNGKDVCVSEAKGKEKLARAELEANYTGKDKDRAKVANVKADAAFDLAKERCDDLAGNTKDVCVQQAKAARTRAKADAKLAHETGEARMKAGNEKRDANYKVEMQKCDALAGDTKSACVANAKANFGKS